MSMRKLGGTLSRELARTGFAVAAVAAVILIYQGCSQPVEPVVETSAPGAVDAQETEVGMEDAPMEAAPEADIALEAPAQLEEPPVEDAADRMMAQAQEGEDPHAGHDMGMAAEVELPTKAIAVITPTVGNDVTGTVTFTQQDGGVLIEADLGGLAPGKHGFHIHEFGDISAPDGTSAGGHFNPMGVEHGAPSASPSHVGDLGNIEAGEDGTATYSQTIEGMKVHYVIGRAMVVHEGEDDLFTQPTGNAGARVGVGVIGIAKAE